MKLNPKEIFWLRDFNHGYAEVCMKRGKSHPEGIIASDGTIRIEPKYDYTCIYQDNGEWMCRFGDYGSEWMTARLDDWDDMGSVCKSDGSFAGTDYFLIKRKGGYKGIYMRTPDNILLDPVYRRIYWDRDGFIVKDSKNRWGIISVSGKIKVPLVYSSICVSMYMHGQYDYYIALKESGDNEKYGVIDRNGIEIIPFEYDKISSINEKYIAVAKYDENGVMSYWRVLDLHGNEYRSVGKDLEMYDYDNIFFRSENPNKDIIDVEIADNFGCIIKIDETEKTYHYLIPIADNNIYSCADGNFRVRRMDTKKWGLVSSKGKGLVPCEYDHLRYGDDCNLITVCKGDEWFCINSRNERVLF